MIAHPVRQFADNDLMLLKTIDLQGRRYVSHMAIPEKM